MPSDRLAIRIGGLALRNPVICGANEAVASAAGIRAALATGAAGVIAKSVNENPAGHWPGQGLEPGDRADA